MKTLDRNGLMYKRMNMGGVGWSRGTKVVSITKIFKLFGMTLRRRIYEMTSSTFRLILLK